NTSLLGAAISGAGQTGAQIKTSGWGDNAANLPDVGALLTIEGVNAVQPQSLRDTGVLQVFTVTAPVSADINSNATLTLYPPIEIGGAAATVTASPADGAAITLPGAAAEPLYPTSIQVLEASRTPPLAPARAL